MVDGLEHKSGACRTEINVEGLKCPRRLRKVPVRSWGIHAEAASCIRQMDSASPEKPPESVDTCTRYSYSFLFQDQPNQPAVLGEALGTACEVCAVLILTNFQDHSWMDE